MSLKTTTTRPDSWWRWFLGCLTFGLLGWVLLALLPANASALAVDHQAVTTTSTPDGHDHAEEDPDPAPDGTTPDGEGDGNQNPAERGPAEESEGERGDGESADQADGAASAGCESSELELHDGEQEGQRCAPTVLGELPDPEDIPAVLITSPPDGATLRAGEDFQVVVAVRDLATGRFADPDTQYYTRPQELDAEGRVIGHAHVAVQRLDAQDPEDVDAPAATDFEFFQGLEEEAEDGRLVATVPGLDAGVYRVLVNAASEHHAPTLSPVAQHTFAVDGIRIQVLADDPDEGADDPDGDTDGDGTAPLDPEALLVVDPGDGIPPAPTEQRAGEPDGDGAQPPAATANDQPADSEGAPGDGRPPQPERPIADQGEEAARLPFAGGSSDLLLMGAGALIAIGVALTAVSRRRPGTDYQGRHLRNREDPAGTWSTSLAELLPDESEAARR